MTALNQRRRGTARVGRTVFGGVGQDDGLVMSAGIELVTDRANPAVHHVRWRDDVCAGDRVGDRRTGQQRDAGIVDDRLPIDDAAVTV